MGAKQATLIYDPMGRLWEVDGEAGGGVVTRFLYDGDALVAEYDVADNLMHRYVHGVGADVPHIWCEGAELNDNTRLQLFANWQGSITTIIKGDESGDLVNINGYDAYGIANETNIGRFQYTGQIALPELGLYHYKARVYSPTLGRFLQTDPIGYEGQVNLYAYVGNDPVNLVDPMGLCGHRYEDGSCEVKVDSATGQAGIDAGKALEDQLNAYDAQINALDDDQLVPINDSKGNLVGMMSGEDVKGVWNNQKFEVTTEQAAGRGNVSKLGSTTPGLTTLSPKAVTDYGNAAMARGGSAQDGYSTLVFHEIGHATPWGWQANTTNPGAVGQPAGAGERAANKAGGAVAREAGGTLRCKYTGFC